MASRAEVEAVTVCPAASRMAHLRVTTCGSSSTQRILAIKGDVLNADALFEFMARLRRILAAAQKQLTKLPYSQPPVMLKSNKCAVSLRVAVPFALHTLGRVSRKPVYFRPSSQIGARWKKTILP